MYLLILYFFLTGCSSGTDSITPSIHWVEIKGRNEGSDLDRMAIYRAKAPSDWQRHTPSDAESRIDTTKPIDEFSIDDGKEHIRIVIHNFPTNRIEDRIPPNAQVTRWKRQFDQINPADIVTVLQAHGGFAGLFFYGVGLIKSKPHAVLAWSMQLAPEHYRTLNQQDYEPYYRQRSADFTIKATGSPDAINRHKSEIIDFANSFELIHEIPMPS